MLVLPLKALQLLIENADSNVNDHGLHVETLAFLLAVRDGDNYNITDVVFPTQSSGGDFVEDHGVDSQDTSSFLQSLCQRNSKVVIGWFHTHVRGTPLMLSSVDCHTQFLYETAAFTDIKAFVLHLPSRSLDCYELTPLGVESVRLCSLRFPEKATSQHLECFQPSFYRSLRHLLINNDSAFTVIDARRSQPFSQPLNAFEKFLHGSELSSVQQIQSSTGIASPESPLLCGLCGKVFRDIESKRKHQSRTKCKILTSKAAVSSPVKVSEVHTFLKQPCKCCSKTFQNESTALQHFSRSSCKMIYKDVLSERQRMKRLQSIQKPEHSVKVAVSIKNRAHYQKNRNELRLIRRERYRAHAAAKKNDIYREKLAQLMKAKYRDQLKNKLDEKYAKTLKFAMKEKYNERLKNSLKEKYRLVLKKHLMLKYLNKLKTPMKEKYDLSRKEHLRNKYQSILKQSLKEKYRRCLRDSLRTKYKEKLKERLHKKYIERLKEPLREKYQASLRMPLQEKYQTVLKETLRIKYRDCLKNTLQIKYQQSLKTACHLKYETRKSQNTFQKLLNEFHRIMCLGLSFECLCCERVFFENSVVHLSANNISKISPDILIRSVYPANFDESNFICHCCFERLKKNEIPSLSARNSLMIEPIPEELALSDFEMQLIAKDLLFMKIFKLPKSRMPAIKDKVINVPLTYIDIQTTANVLPRKMDESLLVNVQLKRSKDLKNVHSQALVRPDTLVNALKYLQSCGNPFYNDIILNEKFLSGGAEVSFDLDESKDNETDVDQVITEKYDCLDTCLVPQNSAAHVITNNGCLQKVLSETIVVSPGENKLPTNWLANNDFEAKSFPCFFPSGKNTLSDEREIKISS